MGYPSSSMRWLLFGSAVLMAACGGSVEKTTPCRADELNYPKAWFVGDVVEVDDDPTLSLSITVTEALSGGAPAELFVGESMDMLVTAQVTEDYLMLRRDEDVVQSAFRISSHSVTACGASHPQYDGEEPYPVWDEAAQPLWYERPWVRVEWWSGLAPNYDFDEATANGHPEAIEYHPVTYYVEDFDDDLDDDRLALDVKTSVTWNDLDDGTPGCAFDVPDATPETGCPPFELTLRYELSR